MRLGPALQQFEQPLLLRGREFGPPARRVPPAPQRVDATCTDFAEPIADGTGNDTEGGGNRPPSPPRLVQFDCSPSSPLFRRC